MNLLPKVSRTEGNISNFEPSKIYESVLKETGISDKDAASITELVVRRIISSGIKFLSGPHIREMVCSVLSEQHFESERKLYTRIGMPLMDYEEILEKVYNGNLINPEKTHHWAANQISKEYAHLRLLDAGESKAHLFGDIHINGLNYYDSRPFNQIWDLRLILKTGFPSFNGSKSFCKIKAANNLIEAVRHISKWIGMTQSEFYGIQGFNNLTVYLAPYAQGLSQEKIKHAMTHLICEINRISLVIGREIPPISISSSPIIFKELAELPAITPGGRFKGIYDNYHEECLKLFKALTFAFKEEYQLIPLFKTPRHQIIFDNSWSEDNNEAYLNVWDEIKSTKNSYLFNFCNNNYKKRFLEQISTDNYDNNGELQNICLNLPRCAYQCQNEDKLFDILIEKINLCSEIFLKKYDMIKKRIASKHLPLCSGSSNGFPIFNLDNQKFSISFVGLNETVKFLTNYELHENADSFSYGIRVVKEMNKICLELSRNNNKNYILNENISEKAINRFSKLDFKHFKNQIKSIFKEKNNIYSNSFHFRDGIKIDLFKRVKEQGEFHRMIHTGAVEHISLHELRKYGINLNDFVKKVCKDSNLACVKFKS
ncbi:hypothetical protein LCGC14_1488190 [marine sediment metagenome]|uniref:ATP-cone domain-containing protein n=1 Tax=marine sediment metagenome TaxID=412755 RepID=A0A0F9J860_9ZZZZ